MKPSLVNHDDFISPVSEKPTIDTTMHISQNTDTPRSLFNPTIIGIIVLIIFVFVLYDRHLHKNERKNEYNQKINNIVSKINIQEDLK